MITVLSAVDPFFMYRGLLTPVDYEKIKVEHNLFVGFNKFLDHLIELLKKCSSNGDVSDERFMLQIEDSHALEPDSTSLKVVEINELRKLTHLSINIKSCSEKEVRTVMTNRLKFLQEEKVQYKILIEELRSTLSEKHKELELQRTENLEIKESSAREIQKVTECCFRDLQEGINKAAEAYSESERKLKAEMTLKDKQHEEQIIAAEKHINELTAQLQEINCVVAELRAENKHLLEEREKNKAELHNCKDLLDQQISKNNALEDCLRAKEEKIWDFNCKYKEVLKDFKSTAMEMKEADEQVKMLKAKEEQLKKQLSRCEQEMFQKKAEQEETLKVLNTLNQSLGDAKKENHKLNVKYERSGQIILEQEKCIKEIKAAKSALENRFADMTRDNKELLEKVEQLEKDFSECKASLNEKQTMIKNNESVITYLSSQLRNMKQHTVSRETLIPKQSTVPAKSPLSMPVSKQGSVQSHFFMPRDGPQVSPQLSHVVSSKESEADERKCQRSTNVLPTPMPTTVPEIASREGRLPTTTAATFGVTSYFGSKRTLS